MGLMDVIFNGMSVDDERSKDSENGKERPIATITGVHCFGLNLKDDAKVTAELYEDRLVLKNKMIYLAEYDMDDVLDVDGRYEDVNTGSVTTSHEETSLASSVAMMSGDWAAAYFFKPNKTTYETKHKVERRYFLEIDTMKSNIVLQVYDQDDLIYFIDECKTIIDKYEYVEEDETFKLPSMDSLTDSQFDTVCVKYLEFKDFTNIVLLPESDDERVSIVAEKDEVKYAVRCIKSDSEVGVEPILGIESGRKHYRCHVGMVITNAVFSKDAIKVAADKLIMLRDKDRLK